MMALVVSRPLLAQSVSAIIEVGSVETRRWFAI